MYDSLHRPHTQQHRASGEQLGVGLASVSGRASKVWTGTVYIRSGLKGSLSARKGAYKGTWKGFVGEEGSTEAERAAMY